MIRRSKIEGKGRGKICTWVTTRTDVQQQQQPEEEKLEGEEGEEVKGGGRGLGHGCVIHGFQRVLKEDEKREKGRRTE